MPPLHSPNPSPRPQAHPTSSQSRQGCHVCRVMSVGYQYQYITGSLSASTVTPMRGRVRCGDIAEGTRVGVRCAKCTTARVWEVVSVTAASRDVGSTPRRKIGTNFVPKSRLLCIRGSRVLCGWQHNPSRAPKDYAWAGTGGSKWGSELLNNPKGSTAARVVRSKINI